MAIRSLILCLAASQVGALTVRSETQVSSFEGYLRKFNLSYAEGTSEYAMRERLFTESLVEVQRQNSKPGRLWTATVNAWSAHTPDEIRALSGWSGGVGGFETSQVGSSAFLETSDFGAKSALPEEHNWQHLWAMQKSEIHNQGCGNCWATATASLLEAHYQIHIDDANPRHFNFMEITECTANPYNCGGSGGCGGAVPELALFNIMKHGIGPGDESAKVNCPKGGNDIGELLHKSAPHEVADGVYLSRPDSLGRKVGLVGWERLPINEEEPLRRALVERGPVAVAISTGWKNYGSGVYDSCSKDSTIGHAVLLIGYGKDSSLVRDGHPHGVAYWTIQNSWGQGWGEQGHARFLRHVNNDFQPREERWCGKDRQPQMGNGCDGGPTEVDICGMCGILYDTVVPYMEVKTTRSIEMARLRGG